MSEKHKKTCKDWNYFENLHNLSSAFTGCVSVSALNSLIAFHVGIKSSAIGLKIHAITTRIRNYKSIIKKKKKNFDKIVLLGKAMLDTIEILISKALIDLYIGHDKFSSVNNALKNINKSKKKWKTLKLL